MCTLPIQMPVQQYPPCPGCGEKLVRKPAGRCPACGAEVADYVTSERNREERIERVVAVVSTVLVITVVVGFGGFGVFEGVLMYAAGGALVWYLAKGTFGNNREPGDRPS